MKILVVDDHILVREGLCYVLEKLTDNINIVEADNYEQAVSHLKNLSDIDLIILDLLMPGENGFSLLEFCRASYPSIATVVLSASKNPNDMQRALKSGAMGFIPKHTTSQIMLSALRTIIAGELYIPTSMSGKTASAQKASDSSCTPFTPRQIEVMTMIGQGLSNKSIALKLGISESTTKMHVTSVFKRLGVHNRTEAAIAAQKLSEG